MAEPHFQLPLPIHQSDDETLENFYAENNLLLLNSLQKNFLQLHQQFFYLWGNKGSGKSHLLKGVCQHYLAQQRPALYVPVQLPDLASRLTWGEVYQLAPLNDKQKIDVLQKAAYQRGIELPDETANFLFKRLERDMKTLFNALEKLDQASLQAQRKLTIPFVKEILAL